MCRQRLINNLDDVFKDPQVLSRDMKIAMAHAKNGHISLVGSPIKLSRTPVKYKRPPPTLGQHTQEILGDGKLKPKF